MVKKLREAEVMLNNGKTLEEVLKVLEVSEATYNRWRNQYRGMKNEEAKRQKQKKSGLKANPRMLATASKPSESITFGVGTLSSIVRRADTQRSGFRSLMNTRGVVSRWTSDKP